MKSFRYEFTMKELKYYLFNKKKCPKCQNKMIKSKGYELVNGSIFNSASTPLYIQGRDKVKHYHDLFNCSKCGSQYTMKELAEKKAC